MEICKAPTLRLKALNKHTHIKYIEMENVIQFFYLFFIYRQVFNHNYANDTHTHTHTRTRTHTHTHTHTHTVQTDGSEGQCGLTEIF